MNNPTPPLSPDERIELANTFDEMLVATEKGMTLPAVEGLFMALATVPDVVMPSTWVPLAIDVSTLDFETAQVVMGKVMRLYNTVIEAMADLSSEWVPLYGLTDDTDTVDTALGFMVAMERFAPVQWDEYCRDYSSVVDPIFIVAAFGVEDAKVTKRQFKIAEKELFNSIYQVFVDFAPSRGQTIVTPPIVATATPGRNEPCLCGSGKKYKNCHGRSQVN